MKVLLIQPPAGLYSGESYLPIYTAPPLGLAYIAAVLEKNKIDVKILDCFLLKFTKEDLANFIKKEQPDIIGITALTPSILDAFEVAKIAKNALSKIKVVIGGPHASMLPYEVASNQFVDFVCIGEGEYSMLEIVTAISNNKDFSNIEGIVYKKDSEIIINPTRKFIEDLDSLPFPAHHLLPMGQYNPKHHWGKNLKWAPMVTGRGCPFQCMFCAEPKILGSRHRFRSAGNIIKEIELLYHKFGIQYISFEDSTFTINKERLEKLCNLIIERKLNIKWKCNSRISTLPNKELLKLMKRSGCRTIFFGIESGNPQILKKIKQTSIPEIIKAIKLIKTIGIGIHCAFIFGLPGENRSTINETINFAIKLNPDTVGFHILFPLPGTDIFNFYDKLGIIITKDWSKYVREPTISFDDLSPDYFKKMRIKAYKKFYLRPKNILRRIIKLSSISELKDYYSICVGLLKGKLQIGLPR